MMKRRGAWAEAGRADTGRVVDCQFNILKKSTSKRNHDGGGGKKKRRRGTTEKKVGDVFVDWATGEKAGWTQLQYGVSKLIL